MKPTLLYSCMYCQLD